MKIKNITKEAKYKLYDIYLSLLLNPWTFEQFLEEDGICDEEENSFLLFKTTDIYDICALGVAKTHQGQGLGTLLLNHMPKNMPMVLEVSVLNKRAIFFYKRYGFKVIHRRPLYGYYKNILSDFLVMIKKNHY